MCGLVGAVSGRRNVVPILVDGLRRLEYRGYDSAGLAALVDNRVLKIRRAVGSVERLAGLLAERPVNSTMGIAHTRWATHGSPTEGNAHPQVSNGSVAVVHNGIIENYEKLKLELEAQGYQFLSETDTEVIAHCVHAMLGTGMNLRQAVRATCERLHGSYAIAVVSTAEPGHIVATRHASPLLVGVGDGEYFVASDMTALLPVTRTLIRLEDDDLAEMDSGALQIFDTKGQPVQRPVEHADIEVDSAEKHGYRHFMLKEIFEQGQVLRATLAASEAAFTGPGGACSAALLKRIGHVHLVACGTSYHACLVASYLIEALAGIPCTAELASEYRYRQPAPRRDSLFVALSQSGETADTLAALRLAKTAGYLATMTICNVRSSSMIREADTAVITRAGIEIGVASTKAFTAQLMTISQLTIALASAHNRLAREKARAYSTELARACVLVESVLELNQTITELAHQFVHSGHVMFVGRGPMYPVAMEGALKLKEISYIHAEAYAAGELKHGPLALVDEHMPVIALAPANSLLGKLKSNLEEILARHGRVYVFADQEAGMEPRPGMTVVEMPATDALSAPIVYTVPLQMLAYHVAALRGNDVDRPRNLAKSVTVE